MSTRTRCASLAVAALLTAASTAGASPAQASGTACVGGPKCYPDVQAAVNAAYEGDTITINAGTFSGGVTIGKSLRLVGAGPGRTILRGGGPVVTIASTTSKRPTVTVSGLTVTGGVSNAGPFGSYFAYGGGIFVAPTLDDPSGWATLGATVTLDNVLVTGNQAAAKDISPYPSGVKCPEGDCPFAGSLGGGIANFGDLTVRRSVVSGNDAGGRVSDAVGGGIWNAFGDLRIESSVISDNQAQPREIGRYAEGGGIFVQAGSLTVRDSKINGNRAHLITSWPLNPQGVWLDMNANSGGIHIGDGIKALIVDSQINGNSVLADDPYGEPSAIDAALIVGESSLVMRGTVVKDNTHTENALTTQDVAPLGSAIEVNGPAQISDTRIEDNSVTVTTSEGLASATGGGLAALDFTGTADQVSLNRVSISGNTASARSAHGPAEIIGVGVFNNAAIDMRDVTIAHNIGTASGTQTGAQGGGIWNGPLLSGDVPVPVVLTMRDTKIVDNALRTTPPGESLGGGIYTTTPITMKDTTVARNLPDQCFGCSLSTTPNTTMPRNSAPGHARAQRNLPAPDTLKFLGRQG